MVSSRIRSRNQIALKKVKCILVQALRLCTGRTAHRGSRGIALLFHDHGSRKGWGVSVTPRPLFTPGKDPVLCTGGWVGAGPVWTGAENLALTGIRSPDRPACSQSLYRLSYRAHKEHNYCTIYTHLISAHPFNANITCLIETKDLKPNQTWT
jgi:hypothetical protein